MLLASSRGKQRVESPITLLHGQPHSTSHRVREINFLLTSIPLTSHHIHHQSTCLLQHRGGRNLKHRITCGSKRKQENADLWIPGSHVACDWACGLLIMWPAIVPLVLSLTFPSPSWGPAPLPAGTRGEEIFPMTAFVTWHWEVYMCSFWNIMTSGFQK